MPTVMRHGPHRFFFFSNEGNEPAHIHVETGDSSAKFWLRPVALATAVGYNSTELRELRKLVEKHAARFQEKWHEHFGTG